MKKFHYLLLGFVTLIFSCEDTTTNEFEEVNGDVKEKLIKNITLISAQSSDENTTVNLSYDSTKKLNSITTNGESNLFVYDNNDDLENIQGQGSPLNIEELYQSPYDALETGQVLEYDNNGNPYKVIFYEEEYDEYYNPQQVEYTAEFLYDNTHNPYFYTLEAAGIIDVLDGVRLDFTLPQASTKIIKARALFPLNNLSKITYKDSDGNIVLTINAEYNYDQDNYPITASVIAISLKDNETANYTITYQYL